MKPRTKRIFKRFVGYKVDEIVYGLKQFGEFLGVLLLTAISLVILWAISSMIVLAIYHYMGWPFTLDEIVVKGIGWLGVVGGVTLIACFSAEVLYCFRMWIMHNWERATRMEDALGENLHNPLGD